MLPPRAATSTTSGWSTTGTGRLTADEARSRSWRRVIGFGDLEHLREFNERAEKGAEVELAQAVDVISEERGKLLERVNAAVADGNRRRELALIEKAVQGAGTPGGHGALGLIDVQRYLNGVGSSTCSSTPTPKPRNWPSSRTRSSSGRSARAH